MLAQTIPQQCRMNNAISWFRTHENEREIYQKFAVFRCSTVVAILITDYPISVYLHPIRIRHEEIRVAIRNFEV